jgi:oxygen-independent coproporphyrinogen-3 oxidase
LLFLSGFSNDETEFTIECNPEFITKTQCEILKKNGVNRISLGIQSTNDEIVKKYNRSHNMEIVNAAIEMLCDYGKINNISCDFIYGFSEQTFSDLKNDITFVTKNDKIKHVSFYSLELKENSILTKNKYHLDEEKIDDMFSFLLEELKKSEFIRYEISSFAKDEKYFSKHNIAY